MHYICNILDWALLLSLWSCLINYFTWAKQKWEETIQLQLGKFFFLWGSVLRSLSTTSQLSICTSKEVKNLQQQPVHSRESATARRAQERSTASTCL